MKKIFAFIALFILAFSANVCAECYDVRYEKVGEGRYIYCNNPEFVTEDMLCGGTGGGQYLMNCTSLEPGKYTLFFCFTNMTGKRVEPDVEFKSTDGAEITITKAGYCMPQGNEYWDCLGAWADYLDIDILTSAGTERYVHYSGEKGLPYTLDLSDGTSRWAKDSIYNYTAIAPSLSFNMLLDFTIEGGTADVNCLAFKSGADRATEAFLRRAEYISDTAVKGIADTLPIAEAKFDIDITPELSDGKNLVMRVYNNYFAEGNLVPYWITNINPARDGSAASVAAAALSDMLAFEYEDEARLWHIDTEHFDTEGNEPIEAWDLKNQPDTGKMFNLGNFGVTNRHHITVTNSDTRPRSLNYYIESACSSNIVIVRDENGNMLNPVTLTAEKPYAINKSITADVQTAECMFGVLLMPGEKREFIVDVILPTNTFGGQKNYFTVSDKNEFVCGAVAEFPEYGGESEWDGVFFTGGEYMKWQGEKLVRLDGGEWTEVQIMPAARDILASEEYDVTLVRTDNGYAAKYSAWDGIDTLSDRSSKNKVYFFDENMEYVSEYEFGDYIYNMVYSDHTLYVQTDAFYQSEDSTLRRFVPIEDATIVPVTNGAYTLMRRVWPYYRRQKGGGSGKKVVFEGGVPQLVYATDGLFYYIKSEKETAYDTDTENVVSVSRDGLCWTDLELPDSLTKFGGLYRAEGKITAVTKYESFEFEDVTESVPAVMINGEYFSFKTSPEIKDGRVCIPLGYFADQLGAKTEWLAETRRVRVTLGEREIVFEIGSPVAWENGCGLRMDTEPYIKDGKTMVPLRFFAKKLGCAVKWDGKTNTVKISW